MEFEAQKVLQKRLERKFEKVKLAEYTLYHIQLSSLWRFLNSNSLISSVLKVLESKNSDVFAQVKLLIEKIECPSVIYRGKPEEYLVFRTDEEQAAAGYFAIKLCLEDLPLNTDWSKFQRVLRIGNFYTEDSSISSFPESAIGNNNKKTFQCLSAFNSVFIEPLYVYIETQLDSQRFLLNLLSRYKQSSEWFRRDELYELTQQNSENQTGRNNPEWKLTLRLFEYLHSQGITLYLESKSPLGENRGYEATDLISEQIGDERLIAEAKVFKDDKTVIVKGFHQIYTYVVKYNQIDGYLIVFNTTENEISFSGCDLYEKLPIFTINNKIFVVVIDIGKRESASQRGRMQSCKISKNDLLREINL